jgi:hypothetical protein
VHDIRVDTNERAAFPVRRLHTAILAVFWKPALMRLPSP